MWLAISQVSPCARPYRTLLLLSEKTILISLLSSMDLANSFQTYASWLMVESVGLNPEWYSDMIVFSFWYSEMC